MKNSDLITLLGQYPANAEVSIAGSTEDNKGVNHYDIAHVVKNRSGNSFIDLAIGRLISTTK